MPRINWDEVDEAIDSRRRFKQAQEAEMKELILAAKTRFNYTLARGSLVGLVSPEPRECQWCREKLVLNKYGGCKACGGYIE